MSDRRDFARCPGQQAPESGWRRARPAQLRPRSAASSLPAGRSVPAPRSRWPRRPSTRTRQVGKIAWLLLLSHEELAGWMVRSVNVLVTVHARSTEHAVALVDGDGVVVVNARRMLGRDVTALTEHRHPHREHAVVGRSVRIVAGRAVLPHRCVLPQRRSAHLGVAAVAGLVDGGADFQRLDVGDRAVRVVARTARHLPFAYRHVRNGAFGLGDLQTMTGCAELGLGRLDELMRGRRRVVDAVARDARQVSALVRASFPPGVHAAVVTAETGLVGRGRRRLREFHDVPLGVVVDVRLPGTVAALAAVRGCRRAWILALAVGRALERVALAFVTHHARIGAGVGARDRRGGLGSRRLRGHRSSGGHCARGASADHPQQAERSERESVHRSAIRKLARSYAAGSGILPRLMLPRISPSELHSCSTIHASTSSRTRRRWFGPLRSSADTICVACAPAIVDLMTSRPVWMPPVIAIDALIRPDRAAAPRRRISRSAESDSGVERTISSSLTSMSARPNRVNTTSPSAPAASSCFAKCAKAVNSGASLTATGIRTLRFTSLRISTNWRSTSAPLIDTSLAA